MSKKTTLERAYLHVNNGGFSFSIVERIDVRKDDIVLPPNWPELVRQFPITPEGNQAREEALARLPRQDMHNRRWVFQVETHHFGSGVKFGFPLVPLNVKWMIWALQRVLGRMERPQNLPTDGVEFAFQDARSVHVTAVDGTKTDFGWPMSGESHTDSKDDSGSSEAQQAKV